MNFPSSFTSGYSTVSLLCLLVLAGNPECMSPLASSSQATSMTWGLFRGNCMCLIMPNFRRPSSSPNTDVRTFFSSCCGGLFQPGSCLQDLSGHGFWKWPRDQQQHVELCWKWRTSCCKSQETELELAISLNPQVIPLGGIWVHCDWKLYLCGGSVEKVCGSLKRWHWGCMLKRQFSPRVGLGKPILPSFSILILILR